MTEKTHRDKKVILFHATHQAVLKEYLALFSFSPLQMHYKIYCLIDEAFYLKLQSTHYGRSLESIQFIEYNKKFNNKSTVFDLFEGVIKKIITVSMMPIKIVFHLDLGLFFNSLFNFNQIQKFIDREVREINPTIILCYSERSFGIESALIQCAYKKKIPSLVIPISHSDQAAQARCLINHQRFRQDFSNESLVGKALLKRFPNWVYNYQGTQLFFNPHMLMLAIWVMDWMPKNPWLNAGTGNINRMAMESQREYDWSVSQGISPEKLVVTGKASSDFLFEQIENRELKKLQLCKELGLDSDKKILLCSLPQLAEHNMMDWEDHWREIEFLLDTFSKLSDVQILISLHPKCDPASYKERLQQYNAVLGISYPIEELIPIADIFVAILTSSTVFMSIANSIPTVLINFYNLTDSLFENENSLIVVDDKSRLIEVLNTLLTNNTVYFEKVHSIEKIKDYWYLIDGNARMRIFQVIQSMTLTDYSGLK